MGRKAQQNKIARKRVNRLLDFASSIFKKKPELSHRYSELAWKIKTRHNLRLPPSLNRRFCRKCQGFLVPGTTCRVRLRPHPRNIVITCLRCGYQKRIPYDKRKKEISPF